MCDLSLSQLLSFEVGSLTHLCTSFLSCIAENRDSVQLYPDAGSNWADVQRE